MTRSQNMEGESNINTDARLTVEDLKQFTGSEHFYPL